jgi:hypothetical protein
LDFVFMRRLPILRQPSVVVSSVIGAVLLIHAWLLASAAYQLAPVTTELGHLPSGISHWQLLRFDAYRVNPPLVRMVAALPVIFANPKTDWRPYNTDPLRRCEEGLGKHFAEANGAEVFWLYTLGRWACIPFSVLGGYICFVWAKALYGSVSGLVSCMLWCFCPMIVGHGALMMPDVASAALGAAAAYVFWKWMVRPSWSSAVEAGLVLGAAELAKTTLLIFYPLWCIAWLFHRVCNNKHLPVRWTRDIKMMATQACISVCVINAGYAFDGFGQQLGDYVFASNTLKGLTQPGNIAVHGNRFAGTMWASLPIPLPKDYVQGIDTQKADFEGGRPSYLGGTWSEHGWWYFYLYAASVKLPLGTLLLFGSAVAVLLVGGYRASLSDEMFLLIALVGITSLVSSEVGFSIHFRYIIPALPFMFVFSSRLATVVRNRRAMACVTGLLVLWTTVSSVSTHPHCLSYFNEVAGGPQHGHGYLLESNIAWGQDLLFLKQWHDSHPYARPFHLAIFSNIDPRLAGIEFTVPMLGRKRSVGPAAPKSDASVIPTAGWYAVDVNYLHQSPEGCPDGKGGLVSLNREGFDVSYFSQFEPVARVGWSIYIYYLSPAQLKQLDAAFEFRQGANP